MDIDSYILQHSGQWDRLAELAAQRRLSGVEADELVELYQRVGTQLSLVQASAYDPVLEARLTSVLANARAAINGGNVAVLSAVGVFFGAVFPAAVYRLRWLSVAVALATIAIAVLMAYRVLDVPGLADSILSPAQQNQLVNHDFADYYTENPSGDFAFLVWVNNARVSAIAISLGVLVLPLAVVLFQNAFSLGVTAGLMALYGRLDVFFLLILPHGLLELTAVFIAGAAGLNVAWAWISPGARSRTRALATEGRTGAAVALGLVLVLAVSGVLEGFLTGSPLHPILRVIIGAVVWIGFLIYVGVLGRRAIQAGYNGDIDPKARSAEVPTEAAL